MTYSIYPTTISLDEDSAGTQYFTIWRDDASKTEVVYVSTFQNWRGSGVYNNNDYVGLRNVPLTFQKGWEYVKTNAVGLEIIDDDKVEPDETFGIVVHTGSGKWLTSTSFTILPQHRHRQSRVDDSARHSHGRLRHHAYSVFRKRKNSRRRNHMGTGVGRGGSEADGKSAPFAGAIAATDHLPGRKG